MAAVRLIAGWISGAVLGMAIAGTPELRLELSSFRVPNSEPGDPSPARRTQPTVGLVFSFLAAGLVGLTIISRLEFVSSWFPTIDPYYAWGGLILVGMGSLKLGFTVQPFHIILALLTALAGFEILYAALETSVISAGLLATVNLSLALIGAYLLTAPYMEV